jgi:hypothetical protein
MFVNPCLINKWSKPSDSVINELMTDTILDYDLKHYDGD